ncbi:MAG TPA: hypothetical protein VHX44_09905 [Planctomycetota bacterium]|nr:hypothetical protein [Planctomycetota bacterium]
MPGPNAEKADAQVEGSFTVREMLMRYFTPLCSHVIPALVLTPLMAIAADTPPPVVDADDVPPPAPQSVEHLIDGEPPEADKTIPGHKAVEIAAVPYPTADPALGVGVTLINIIAIRRSPQNTRPITIAGGAMWADSGSWGAGGGVRAPIMDDRVRLVGGGGASHIEYDFFGIGEDAGATGKSVPMIQEGGGGMAGAMFRTWPDFYIGPRVLAGGMRTRLDIPASRIPPELQGLDLDTSDRGYGFGVQGEWDTRDSTFYPTAGWYVKGDVNWMTLDHGLDVPGRDEHVNYGRVNLAANRYWSPWTAGVLAMRASTAWRGEDTPFY